MSQYIIILFKCIYIYIYVYVYGQGPHHVPLYINGDAEQEDAVAELWRTQVEVL